MDTEFLFLLLVIIFQVSVRANPDGNDSVITVEESIGPARLLIVRMDGFPRTTYFAERQETWNPMLMRHAAKASPAFNLWKDDAYFLKMKEEESDSLSVRTDYFKPQGPLSYFMNDLYTQKGSFIDFINSQKTKGFPIATTLPPRLKKDVLVPCPLQCERIMDDLMVDAFLWMGAKGIATKIHTEAVANIVCVYRGEMKFVLLDHVAWDRFHKRADNTILDTSPFRVEVTSNDTHEIDLAKGDCLFIPENTAYYAQSGQDIVAVSILWKNDADTVNSARCTHKCNPLLTLDGITFKEYQKLEEEIDSLKKYVDTLRNSKFDTPRKYLEERMQEFAEFDIYKTRQGQMLRHVGNLTLEIVDKNKDSVFSDGEVNGLSKSEWLNFGHNKKSLEHFLEHFNAEANYKHDEL